MNEQTVTVRLQFLIRARDSLGRGTLHESAGLRIKLRPEKVVSRRVAHLQPDRRIELRQLHEITFAKLTSFIWGVRSEGLLHQVCDRPQRCHVQLLTRR